MKSFKRRKLFVYGSLLGSGLALSLFFTNCAKSSFEAAESLGDPLFEYAWHIMNTGQKVFATHAGTAGIDLNIKETWSSGLSGHGVRILVSDDGVEDAHQDLRGNYLYGNLSKNYTKAHPYLVNNSPPINKDDSHGTSVAGLIAAVGNNGVGSKGVAFGAKIVSANFLSSAALFNEAILLDQANGEYDIFNFSWGVSFQNSLSKPVDNFQGQIRAAALNRRGGKGAIFVKAAGNDFYVTCGYDSSKDCIGNSNFDSDNVYPFTIITAALNANGDASSYSSPGSNIWISSFGGEYGDDSPAMITTDRMGCNLGFAQTAATGTVRFEKGANGNTNCNYTATFNGTSSAAPVLSGVVALMLEARPSLTWRDIKYILAKTAIAKPTSQGNIISPPTEASPIPTGAVWERSWVTNSAGFQFHNWFGFGRVDVDAAVNMARNYVSHFGEFKETSFDTNKSTTSLSPLDDDAAGATGFIDVGTNYKIESVQLRINGTHPKISQLAFELTSPSQTKSYLVNMNNSLVGNGFVDIVFLSNAFYQENSSGRWYLKVIDGRPGDTGTITNWSLRFTGTQN